MSLFLFGCGNTPTSTTPTEQPGGANAAGAALTSGSNGPGSSGSGGTTPSSGGSSTPTSSGGSGTTSSGSSTPASSGGSGSGTTTGSGTSTANGSGTGTSSGGTSTTPSSSGGTSAGTSGGTTSSGSSSSATSTSASIQHVVVVVEENHSYSEVIGSSSMPYLNSLASKYGLAKNYYANAHPSLPNYFEMTTGNTITSSDTYTGTVTAPNVITALAVAGKSWKVYAESLPSVGYTGGDVYPYIKRHNPFTYFSNVLDDPAKTKNIVPFSEFESDVAANALPAFSFVVPNILDDAHDGSLAQADGWLSDHIGPLVKSGAFAHTLLLIVFDEGDFSDTSHGGGHVAAVVAGGSVKSGYESTTFYQHQNLLRTMLEALGVGGAPGAAASAASMKEFLN